MSQENFPSAADQDVFKQALLESIAKATEIAAEKAMKGLSEQLEQVRIDVKLMSSTVTELQGTVCDLQNNVGAFSSELQAVGENLSDVKQSLESVNQDFTLLRGRISDIESLGRTIDRATKYGIQPLVQVAAPKGNSFREAESDYGLRSPFAQ